MFDLVSIKHLPFPPNSITLYIVTTNHRWDEEYGPDFRGWGIHMIAEQQNSVLFIIRLPHFSIFIFIIKLTLLSTSGDGSADHTITDGLLRVIWSFGQVYPDYFHFPSSGVEAGTVKNERFYQPDELKYHGSRNRGATSLNFFG